MRPDIPVVYTRFASYVRCLRLTGTTIFGNERNVELKTNVDFFLHTETTQATCPRATVRASHWAYLSDPSVRHYSRPTISVVNTCGQRPEREDWSLWKVRRSDSHGLSLLHYNLFVFFFFYYKNRISGISEECNRFFIQVP